jgi:hypothetical protein
VTAPIPRAWLLDELPRNRSIFHLERPLLCLRHMLSPLPSSICIIRIILYFPRISFAFCSLLLFLRKRWRSYLSHGFTCQFRVCLASERGQKSLGDHARFFFPVRRLFLAGMTRSLDGRSHRYCRLFGFLFSSPVRLESLVFLLQRVEFLCRIGHLRFCSSHSSIPREPVSFGRSPGFSSEGACWGQHGCHASEET